MGELKRGSKLRAQKFWFLRKRAVETAISNCRTMPAVCALRWAAWHAPHHPLPPTFRESAGFICDTLQSSVSRIKKMKFILLPAFLVIAASLFSSADGQVSSVTLTIASADRVPFATSKTITVAFTLTTALSNGGRITINYPSGFFASCVQYVVSGHPVISSNTESGVSSLVLTVNGTLAAAATTVTLVGLTMGGPNAGSNGITVSTSSDVASSAVASGVIGGQVASVTMTIAAADRAAGATGKAVILVFTTTVALATNDKITISYPSGFFAPAVTPTVAPITLTAGATGATGATSITLTAASAITAGAITVTLSGMTLGGAVANDATGIKVTTVKDLASSGSATGVIGQVTGVTFAIAAADRVAATVTKDVTIAFTLAVALAAADKVTINYPSGFIATSATASSIKVTDSSGAASGDFQVDGAPGSDKLTIAVKTGQTPSGAFTLVLVGLTTGAATVGSATGITVSAPGNAVSAGQDSGQLGAIYDVSVTAITTPTVGNTQDFIFSFKSAVALTQTNTVTITFPSGYFATSAPTSVAGAAAGAADAAAAAFVAVSDGVPDATTFIFKVATSKTPAINVAQVITLAGLTLSATPQMASATGFKVSATGNAISRGVSIGAIGVVVSSLGVMTIAAADRAAGATGKAVTFPFTTTVALVSGDKVTISYPSGFFATAVTPTVSPTSLTAGPTGATSITLTAGSGITAGAITVILSGMTLGGAVANDANGIKVTTDKNPITPTGTATGIIGQVTGVTFAIASADRVAGTTGKDVTIAFNIPVALVATDKVTINYPSGYFGRTASTPSAIKATDSAGVASTLFQADTTAPGATSLTIVVKTGQTPSGASTIVLVGMTMGAATAVSAASITVSAPGNAVSAAADSVAIGGAVTGVFFTSGATLRAGTTNASVTVSFTTASSITATTGKITINYPSGFFATSATPAVYSPATIASSAAPTATAIVLTVGSAAISAGAITVVLGGLTMGSGVACSATGITVSTSADYASSSSLATSLMVAGGGSPDVAGGPSSSKNHASFLYISASFVLAFVFAVLA